jgi:hypothetical protein
VNVIPVINQATFLSINITYRRLRGYNPFQASLRDIGFTRHRYFLSLRGVFEGLSNIQG